MRTFTVTLYHERFRTAREVDQYADTPAHAEAQTRVRPGEVVVSVTAKHHPILRIDPNRVRGLR